MMKRTLVVAWTLAFAVTFSGSVSAQDVNSAIDKAVQKYSTVKTAKGKFEQVNLTALGNEYHLTGEFSQQFPNLLSMLYSNPKGDRFVADGKYNWFFVVSEPKVVQRFPASAAGSVNLIGVFLDKPREKYTLSDSGRKTVAGVATRMVGLVPKQRMPEFLRATVWIEEATGIIRQFEITEQSGGIRRFTFSTLELNVPVDASQFRFVVPAGTKIVDK